MKSKVVIEAPQIIETIAIEAPQIVENEEVIESNFDPQSFVTFAFAAKFLGVRYQQVFQRAVDKNKMVWKQTPVNHVLWADVLDWKAKRSK